MLGVVEDLLAFLVDILVNVLTEIFNTCLARPICMSELV